MQVFMLKRGLMDVNWWQIGGTSEILSWSRRTVLVHTEQSNLTTIFILRYYYYSFFLQSMRIALRDQKEKSAVYQGIAFDEKRDQQFTFTKLISLILFCYFLTDHWNRYIQIMYVSKNLQIREFLCKFILKNGIFQSLKIIVNDLSRDIDKSYPRTDV